MSGSGCADTIAQLGLSSNKPVYHWTGSARRAGPSPMGPRSCRPDQLEARIDLARHEARADEPLAGLPPGRTHLEAVKDEDARDQHERKHRRDRGGPRSPEPVHPSAAHQRQRYQDREDRQEIPVEDPAAP